MTTATTDTRAAAIENRHKIYRKAIKVDELAEHLKTRAFADAEERAAAE